MVTDSGQIVVREQWDHPYKEGSSLFRFHISVANIVQSSVAPKANKVMVTTTKNSGWLATPISCCTDDDHYFGAVVDARTARSKMHEY